jgi:hypothetical protein
MVNIDKKMTRLYSSFFNDKIETFFGDFSYIGKHKNEGGKEDVKEIIKVVIEQIQS